MKISLVFLTCLGIASALPLEANFHKHQNVCSAPNDDPDANCEVDLTIAVDFSLSMKTKANVYELVNYTLDSVVSRFDISKTKVNIAFQSIGTIKLFNSGYFKRFEDLCNFVQLAEKNFGIFGSRIAGLTEVFTTYLAFNAIPIFNRPNVKHVLVIITAINDPFNINFAIPVSQIVRKKAKVVILGINQKNNDSLSRIADAVDFVDFGEYSQEQADFIVEETCGKSSNQSTTEVPTKEPVTENSSTESPTTISPTQEPSEGPTTEEPVNHSTGVPTENPTVEPSEGPITEEPANHSTNIPTENPTEGPINPSTNVPTEKPTEEPANPSTEAPVTAFSTEQPIEETTIEGSGTESPTEEPATSPTDAQTENPTEVPSEKPTTEASGTESPTEESNTGEPITDSPNPTTSNSTGEPTEAPITAIFN